MEDKELKNKKFSIEKLISYIFSIVFIVCAFIGQLGIGFAVFVVGLITTIILKVIKSKKGGGREC